MTGTLIGVVAHSIARSFWTRQRCGGVARRARAVELATEGLTYQAIGIRSGASSNVPDRNRLRGMLKAVSDDRSPFDADSPSATDPLGPAAEASMPPPLVEMELPTGPPWEPPTGPPWEPPTGPPWEPPTGPPSEPSGPAEDAASLHGAIPSVEPVVPAAMVQPDRMPGNNGLAIIALVLGILGFVPPLGIVAIVLGVLALRQVRQRNQAGSGLAVAGIVLGSIAVAAWVVAGSIVVAQPDGHGSGPTAQQTSAYVDELKAGDCFNGSKPDVVDDITIVPCSSPHESQVVTVFEPPPGPYPGEFSVIRTAEQGCSDRADPLVDTTRVDIEPSFIYPADADSWDADRKVLCTVEATSGTVTGSALK